jgi:hypothetical protein
MKAYTLTERSGAYSNMSWEIMGVYGSPEAAKAASPGEWSDVAKDDNGYPDRLTWIRSTRTIQQYEWMTTIVDLIIEEWDVAE